MLELENGLSLDKRDETWFDIGEDLTFELNEEALPDDEEAFSLELGKECMLNEEGSSAEPENKNLLLRFEEESLPDVGEDLTFELNEGALPDGEEAFSLELGKECILNEDFSAEPENKSLLLKFDEESSPDFAEDLVGIEEGLADKEEFSVTLDVDVGEDLKFELDKEEVLPS